VPATSKQLRAASLHASAHAEAPAHGSPEWTEHVPAAHVSAPLQNRPSSHGAASGACTHVPEASHVSVVHGLPSSVQGDPVAAVQVSVVSLHAAEHSPPPPHGLPACVEHVPAAHASEPLQNRPSSHGSALFDRTHALPSQISSVHAFASLQSASAAQHSRASSAAASLGTASGSRVRNNASRRGGIGTTSRFSTVTT
jgi:hypothetical protein